MTGSSRGKRVPGVGALLVMNLLLIPRAPAPPATLTPEMNGCGQGRELLWQLKNRKEGNFTASFFFVQQ